jgi:adenosine deaminase CECR1
MSRIFGSVPLDSANPSAPSARLRPRDRLAFGSRAFGAQPRRLKLNPLGPLRSPSAHCARSGQGTERLPSGCPPVSAGRVGRTRIFQCSAVVLLLFVAGCGNEGQPIGLDARLDHAFARYATAEAAIFERVVVEGGSVDRTEWEGWLAPDADLALGEPEIDELVARHDAIVETALAAARTASVIDLDAIRSDAAEVQRFCAGAPKGGLLHIHPGGTRTAETLREILAELDPLVDGAAILVEANDGVRTMLYPAEVAFLEALPVARFSALSADDQEAVVQLFILPEEPEGHSFVRFEALFSIGDVLLDQDETRKEWMDEKTHLDFLHRAASMGVSYVEFTKVVIPPTAEALAVFEDRSVRYEAETGVVVRWNLAFVRTIEGPNNGTWAQALIDLMETRGSTALVGIDLLANETDTPALEHGQAVYVPITEAARSGRIGLRRTMHAGELGDPRNVRDALLLGSERIGHGYLLQEDPLTLEFARRGRVPVEVSLVSNHRLLVSDDWSTHPFLRFLRLGLRVSLSTDDEGMFRTDIVNECKVAVANTDLQYAELLQMARNSLDAAFLDAAAQQTLEQKLEADISAFEAAW